MKRSHLTAASTMLGLMIAIGCGGAGNSSSSTGTTDATTNGTTATTGTTATGTTGTQQPTGKVVIEALNVAESNPDAPTLYVDPLNIEAGQTVQFQLVEYAADGTRTVLPTTVGPWSITADATAYATITPTSGRLVTKNAGSSSVFKVTVRYLGFDYSSDFKVNNRQANIFSKVVAPDGSVVRGVTVEFFDASGNTVGTTVGLVHQPVEGYFVASVPTSAVSFTIVDDDTLPAAYGDSFIFNGQTYTVGDRNNPAPFGGNLRTGFLVQGSNIFLTDPSDTECKVAPPYELDPNIPAKCEPLTIQLVPAGG